jgi:hypothetical protein
MTEAVVDRLEVVEIGCHKHQLLLRALGSSQRALGMCVKTRGD